MKTWFYFLLVVMLLTGAASFNLSAQAPDEWRDDLAEHMAGTWKLQGQVMGRDAHHDVEAEWVLNHQFLRIHEKTETGAPGRTRSRHPLSVSFMRCGRMFSINSLMHLMSAHVSAASARRSTM